MTIRHPTIGKIHLLSMLLTGKWTLSFWWDAVLTFACSLVLLILILIALPLAGFSEARLVLGIVYVFFVPGYWLQAVLFPHRKDINAAERVGISLGLSVALIPILAFLLDRSPWGLHLWPILIVELGSGLLFMLTALWQRIHLGMDDAYIAELHYHPIMVWSSLSGDRQIAFILAVAVIFIFSGIGIWSFFVPVPDSYMTEYFLLSSDQKTENLPSTVQRDVPIHLYVGVTNLEHSDNNYRVEIWVEDPGNPEEKRCVGRYGPYEIKRGQTMEIPVAWKMPWAGQKIQVELFLFLNGQTKEPYRALRWFLDVIPTNSLDAVSGG